MYMYVNMQNIMSQMKAMKHCICRWETYENWFSQSLLSHYL